MRNTQAVFIPLLALVGLSACDPMSADGFSLPDGDVERGRQAFVDLQCHACHTIAGMELPRLPDEAEPPFIELGGEVTRITTYAELVTSVINPSHRLASGYPEEHITENGESRMPVYNEVMTVQELVDIVRFLQEQSEVVVPQTRYPMYY